ncbi:class I SAM-dependent methyltransferase [Chryseobacterium sp. R2A-55]|uniref:class I SAM-dependent methyltransferase n=1 Tax=Chryseobacterium sp. R2A-55 TaxID=2744445 RepID=UPI001F3E2BD9|nr:methyltransferase domain-containing protein [Chryseobacterium sp. R2A-55]
MSRNNWIEFWNRNQVGFDTIMANTTKYFTIQYFKKFPISSKEVLLDYGCGPGFFLQNCTHFSNSFFGADISGKYIEFCGNKFRNHPNFAFFHIQDPFDFLKTTSLIRDHQITRIVCLSVLQYFPDEETVTQFLDHIFDSPKVHVVFGDVIPKKSSILRETVHVFWESLKNGFLKDYLIFMTKTFFSEYFWRNKAPLLQLDKSFFENYAVKNNLKWEFLNLTIPKTRFTAVLSNREQ